MSAFEIGLAVFVVLAAGAGIWSCYNLIMQNGRLILRLEMLEQRLVQQGFLQQAVNPIGVPAGSVLNDFALPILGGGTMTLSQWRGRKVAVIFLSPHCKYCETLLPDLAAALPEGKETDPAAVIISTGSAGENRKFFAEHRPGCAILLQEDNEVAALYRALATPMAYVVDEHGITLGNAALGPDAVLAIFHPAAAPSEAQAPEVPVNGHSRMTGMRTLASSQINRDGLKAGTRAPDFKLPGLDGSEIALSSFRGRRVLLVFSDPLCQPCTEMLPQLQQVHRNSGDLQVLMIGRGDAELNRKKAASTGITFPVAIQRSWEVSRAYGMFATPIGYLVGEDGILLENVAVGGNAILALAAQHPAESVGAGRSSLSRGA